MRVSLQNNSALCKSAPARFPLLGHRTMAEVMYDEYKTRPRTQRRMTYAEWCAL